MITAYTLFSGSSGNCTYVTSGKTEILIDAGKSCLAIERALNALGTSLSSISDIFVTHEHSDHTCGLEVISKKYNIPVHFAYPSYDKAVHSGTYLKRSAVRHEVIFEKRVGNVLIKSFEVPHDSMQNLGYIIDDGEDIFGTATDMGHITESLANELKICRCALIEANHDKKMLISGPYPQFLKERILSPKGHLSNENCARLACFLADNGVKCVTLGHLSKENNLPKLAYDAVDSLLKANGLTVDLSVASPDEAVLLTRG
ncbi:MAG: MBL fold metallo-hydrolase [Clostridia bacterium]|nr:MBL fold metallo-hydrolase [Clostridia bacterium]